MDGATQRPPDRLLHSFTRMSLTEEGDTSDALRFTASIRVQNAYNDILCRLWDAPAPIRSWIIDQTHDYGTTLAAIKLCAQPAIATLNHDSDQILQLSAFTKQMDGLSKVVDSLSPMWERDRCPANINLSSIVWGSFTFLFQDMSLEGGHHPSINTGGALGQDDLISALYRFSQDMPLSSTFTWMPSCPYVSGYAAKYVSKMYEVIAQCLGKALHLQLRTMFVTDEELQRLRSELDIHRAWIDERLLTLEELKKTLATVAAEECGWRDRAIRFELEKVGELANSGDLVNACRLLERQQNSLSKVPSPPAGVETRQLEFILSIELYHLYRKRRDQRQLATCATKLHTLLSDILGTHSPFTLSQVFGYALEILNLDRRNSTALKILSSIVEASEAIYGPNSPATGLQYSLLGQILTARKQVQGLSYLFRAMDILENTHGEETSIGFDNLAAFLCDHFLKEKQFEKAQSLARRVAKCCEENLGPQHEMTGRYLSTLGFVELSLNNLSDAETIILRALPVLEESFGIEHPETLRAMSNLTSVFQGQWRLEDGIRMTRRVLEIREKTAGPKSWPTIRSMANLGVSLRDAGALEEAKAVLTEAKQRLENPDGGVLYPDIYSDVSYALRGLGDEPDGEAEILRAEEQLQSVSFHPSSTLSQDHSARSLILNLLSLYWGNGRLDDAHRLAKQAVEACSANPVSVNAQEFHGYLCEILEKLPGHEEELLEACQAALASMDQAHQGGTTALRLEVTLGKALLHVGREEEGVQTLMQVMKSARRLEKFSGYWYREAFVSMFRNYTHSTLAGANADTASKPPEFWDRIVDLLGPDGGVHF